MATNQRFQRGRRRVLILGAFGIALGAGNLSYGQEVRGGSSVGPFQRASASKLPPHSISDITAILDTVPRREVPEKRKRARDISNSQPPKSADTGQIASFYFYRGLAARRIGRTQQAINDLEKAVASGAALSKKQRIKALRSLALEETASGKFSNGIRHLRQAIALSESPTFRVRHLSLLSRYVSGTGALSEADGILVIAQRLMEQIRDGADERSVRIWQRFGAVMEARIAFAKSDLLAERGLFRQAETQARLAHAKFDDDYRKNGTKNSLVLRSHSQSEIGLHLLDQGRSLAAEIEVRSALLILIKIYGPNDRRVVRHVNNLAKVLRGQGRLKDAERLIEASIRIQTTIGGRPDSLRMIQSRLWLAEVLEDQGRWVEALEQFNAVRANLQTDPTRLETYLETNPSFALALQRNGENKKAIIVARKASKRRRNLFGIDHELTALARGIHAMALAEDGSERVALEIFRSVAPKLLDAIKKIDGSQSRSIVEFRSVLESYLSLLGRIYKKSPSNSQVAFAAVEAFRIADALRGRSAQQAINASMARAAAGVLELAGLVRREQDTKKRIGALTRLYVNVLSRAIGDQDATHLETLRRLIKSLRGEHQKLRDNISLHFPNYEELMRPALPSFEKARAMLRTSEALLATYVGERETYVWAVPHKGDLEFSVVSASRAEIQELVLRLRRGIEPKGDTLDAVPQFDLDAAHRLFSMLLRVVAKGWKNAKDLLVVADGPLGQVPFSALVTESTSIKGSTSIPFADYRNVPWLAKNYGVTMLPTVSALLSLRRPAYQNPNRHSFVGFADPLFSWEHVEKAAQSTRKRQIVSMQGGETGPAGQFVLRAKPKGIADGGGRLAKLPRLPETAVEVRMIAEVLNADPRKDAITGLNANEHRVKNMDLAQYKVVAFASHALSAGDIHGLFQPAIALTAPDLLGLKEDGLLTMSEILQLKLDADWVVLSACNTAAGSGKGSETVSGLGRAFFYAGARALLVSQWNVETTSARSLVTDLFRRYASDSRLSRAQALRKAMLALIDGAGHRGSNGRMVFSYAHPLFWAAFTLYGSEA